MLARDGLGGTAHESGWGGEIRPGDDTAGGSVKLSRRRKFAVASFEYVPVGRDGALLRLSGRWRSADGSPSGVVLIGTRAARRVQLTALPESPGGGPPSTPWRAAFSAASDLLDGGTAFSLETPQGRVALLPPPVARDLRADAPAVSAHDRPATRRRLWRRASKRLAPSVKSRDHESVERALEASPEK